MVDVCRTFKNVDKGQRAIGQITWYKKTNSVELARSLSQCTVIREIEPKTTIVFQLARANQSVCANYCRVLC